MNLFLKTKQKYNITVFSISAKMNIAFVKPLMDFFFAERSNNGIFMERK